mgnify:CR=1 FL=1
MGTIRRASRLLLVLVVVILCVVPRSVEAQAAFQPRDPATVLSGVNASRDLPGVPLGQIQAIHDWNNDEHNDVISVALTQTTVATNVTVTTMPPLTPPRNGTTPGSGWIAMLMVWIWEGSQFRLPSVTAGTMFNLSSLVPSEEAAHLVVTSVMATDVDRDGYADLIVTAVCDIAGNSTIGQARARRVRQFIIYRNNTRALMEAVDATGPVPVADGRSIRELLPPPAPPGLEFADADVGRPPWWGLESASLATSTVASLCALPVLTLPMLNHSSGAIDVVAFLNSQGSGTNDSSTSVARPDCRYQLGAARAPAGQWSFGAPASDGRSPSFVNLYSLGVVAPVNPEWPSSVISGQADFDGDCVSELFTFVPGLLVISRLHGANLSSPSSTRSTDTVRIQLPTLANAPSAVDFNGDGAIDLSFLVCVDGAGRLVDASVSSSTTLDACRLDGPNAMLFLFNMADTSGSCDTSSSSGCCSVFPNWGFLPSVPVSLAPGTANRSVQLLSFASVIRSTWPDGKTPSIADVGDCLLNTSVPPNLGVSALLDANAVLRSAAAASSPPLMRTGDYNLDRFPDVLLPTSGGPVLLTTTMPVADMSTGLQFSCRRLVAFDPARLGTRDAQRHGLPFFFDLADTGVLDIIVADSRGDANQPFAVLINQIVPSVNYFFTAVALNGAILRTPPGAGAFLANQEPQGGQWGSSVLGGTLRFHWKDVSQSDRVAACTQQSSLKALSLQTPLCHFGLGTTFSYIDLLSLGVPVVGGPTALTQSLPANGDNSMERSFSSSLMPNSQVVVSCYPLLDPSQWHLTLLLPLQRLMLTVLVTLGVSLLFIGSLVLALWTREVREDRRENRQAAYY